VAFSFDGIDQMNADAARLDATTDLPRAGFWRRLIATLIDSIIVTLPFLILAAVLFNVTAGKVQMDSGFSFCAPVRTIPPLLNRPPPHDSNFAAVCRFSLLGAPTGAILTVGRAARNGAATATVSQGYMLDKDGRPIDGTSIDWIPMLAYYSYRIGMVWKTGRTLGARYVRSRYVRLRIIDAARPNASGVPIHKTIIRYLAMMIGFLPMVAVAIHPLASVRVDADAFPVASFKFAGFLGLVWVVVLIYQIAAKKDPVYDKLARTIAIREGEAYIELADGSNRSAASSTG
jgi:RDD family